MKPEQLFHKLKELAEKHGITVMEKNFRKTGGIKVKSGLCTVKGKSLFFLDKHLSFHKKNEILAECLGKMPNENIFVIPAVRELLELK